MHHCYKQSVILRSQRSVPHTRRLPLHCVIAVDLYRPMESRKSMNIYTHHSLSSVNYFVCRPSTRASMPCTTGPALSKAMGYQLMIFPPRQPQHRWGNKYVPPAKPTQSKDAPRPDHNQDGTRPAVSEAVHVPPPSKLIRRTTKTTCFQHSKIVRGRSGVKEATCAPSEVETLQYVPA